MSLPRSIIRNFIIFLMVLVVVVATHASTNLARAEKPREQNNKYLDEEDDVDDIVAEYHDTLNTLFNERIKAALAVKDPELLPTLFLPPAPDADNKRSCEGGEGTPNLSTYCLSQVALREFLLMQQAMKNADELIRFNIVENANKSRERQKALNKAAQTIGPVGTAVVGGAAAVVAAPAVLVGGIVSYFLDDPYKTLERIPLEIDIAERTLDQGLAAYNEFQMALPLHRKYQEIVKLLEAYRDKVAKVRDEVTTYPLKFINVSTTQCT